VTQGSGEGKEGGASYAPRIRREVTCGKGRKEKEGLM